MRIKIVKHVPTNPSPEVGREYEVIRINERTSNGNVYFVDCEGKEVGVLAREMKVVEK